MSKFSTGQDLTDLHREHEQELTEVKDEILRLSDKYSLKCVSEKSIVIPDSCFIISDKLIQILSYSGIRVCMSMSMS